jgi:large conductance mechanosensitive channel
MTDILKGFQKFLLRGNILDLAVAVVVGAAFTGVVQALTKDLITPILGIFGGTPDFSAIGFAINGSQFAIGDFINAVIAFVITAAALYFLIVAPMERVLPKAVTTKECPFCLSKVPLKATKCAFCTSDLSEVDTTNAVVKAPAMTVAHTAGLKE